MKKFFIKNLFDLLFALFLLLVLFPLMAIISVAILVSIGRPIIFKQLRPGYKNKLFTIYKFRTMNDKKDSRGNLLPDEHRLTKIGLFLRKTSLDELPELLNVLKGDMSLVGPRPLLKEYLEIYSPSQIKRHNIKPGITGWAQINGRNLLSWEEKFKLDVWYVENWTILLDIKIILKTILKVLKREGISSFGYSTMPKFTKKNL